MKLGDWATWVGSIGTAVGAIGTIGTLILALKQLNNQREELKKQQKRLDNEIEERKRERKEDQVKKISAWIGKSSDGYNQPIYCINNVSNSPVYGIIITLVGIQGALPDDGQDKLLSEYRRYIDILPPGKFYIKGIIYEIDMCKRYGLEISFKDLNNVLWVKKVNGEIIEINSNEYKSSYEYYKVDFPIDWEILYNEITCNNN